MSEVIRPKALRGIGMTGCSYFEWCKAKVLCGRIKDDIVAAEVPVAPDAEDLSEADSDLRAAMREWGDVHESECTRKDNFMHGESVIVFRVGSYVIERVY